MHQEHIANIFGMKAHSRKWESQKQKDIKFGANKEELKDWEKVLKV